jgi:membrane protease YdiL (CAAX protease family)
MSKTNLSQTAQQESKRRAAGIAAWVQHHQLVTFFTLTYLLTWGLDLAPVKEPLHSIFEMLGAFGPAFSAMLLTALQSGRTGVRALFARLFRWRAGPRWYLFVLLMPFALWLSALGIALLAGWVTLDGVQTGQLVWLPLALLLGGLLYGPLGEEPGWRGFALPRLFQRWSPLASGLMLGVIWGLWHLPVFFSPDTNQHRLLLSLPIPPVLVVTGYLLWAIALSLIVVWVFQHTHGSVLLAVLLHTSVNTALVSLPLLLNLTHDEPVTLVYVGLFVPLTLLVLTRLASSRQPHTWGRVSLPIIESERIVHPEYSAWTARRESEQTMSTPNKPHTGTHHARVVLLSGIVSLALIWIGSLVGWWWLTMLVGLALGFLLRPTWVALAISLLASGLAWGLPLAWLAMSAPVARTAKAIESLLGLTSTGGVAIILLTILYGCFLGVLGTWAGLTARGLSAIPRSLP